MPRPSLQIILLVDGYNIIGAWSGLKKTRDRYGLEVARQELIEVLVNYSAFEGYQSQLVFDAHSSNKRSCSEAVTNHLSVFYTEFGQTADTHIEKFCASYKSNRCQPRGRLIVATSDRAQQQTVLGYGAEWMSSQQLAKEVESTLRRTRSQQRPQKPARGRFLVNSLDAKSQQRLAQLRQGMK
ncbi:MAG: NYN domain-containing protein [Symploca sp. SIO2G7]|nr:NYN domain-containing protein [Symploca sp. SIO2G7]